MDDGRTSWRRERGHVDVRETGALQPNQCMMPWPQANKGLNRSTPSRQPGSRERGHTNAFRTVPCHPDDVHVNVAAMFDPSTHTWKFQEIRALVFGYRSGVINFNRWSEKLKGVVRRCGAILWTMQHNNGSLRDLSQARSSAGVLVNRILRNLGRLPISQEAPAVGASTRNFLALEHDVSKVISHNVAMFSPRASLADKAQTKSARSCTRRNASQFLGSPLSGSGAESVGSGFGTLYRRSHAHSWSFRLNDAFVDVLPLFLVLLRNIQKRVALARWTRCCMVRRQR